MRRFFKILFSLPYAIFFNLRYLPFKQAIKLPIWLAPNVRVKNMWRGGVCLNSHNICLGMVRIGFHEADAVDVYGVHTILNITKGGYIMIKEDAHIGHGAIIHVKEGACLTLGKNFAISGTTSIICAKSIIFGNDVQLSWNSLFIDSDAHQIFSESGEIINSPKEIVIGNNVWIAANTTILKGSIIRDNVVVASNSLINRKIETKNCIIGGIPAKMLKHIGYFKI